MNDPLRGVENLKPQVEQGAASAIVSDCWKNLEPRASSRSHPVSPSSSDHQTTYQAR